MWLRAGGYVGKMRCRSLFLALFATCQSLTMSAHRGVKQTSRSKADTSVFDPGGVRS